MKKLNNTIEEINTNITLSQHEHNTETRLSKVKATWKINI